MTSASEVRADERRIAVEDLGRLVEVTALAGAVGACRLAVGTRRPDLASGTYENQILLFEAGPGEPGADGVSWVQLGDAPVAGRAPCLDREGARLAAIAPAAPAAAAERGEGGEREGGERIVVWDLATGACETVLEWPEAVCELAFSPDGRRLGFVARERSSPQLPYADLAPPPKVLRHLGYRFDAIGWIHDRRRHCYVLDLGSGDVANLSGTQFDDHDLCWYDDEVVVFVSRRHPGRETDNVSDLFRVVVPSARAGTEVAAGGTPDGGAVQLTDSRRSWAGPVRDPESAYLLATYAEVLEYPCHTRLAAIQPHAGEVLDILADHPWALDGGQTLDARGLVPDGDSCILPRAREGRVELVRVSGWRSGKARAELVAPSEDEPATVKALTGAGGRLVAAIAGTSRPVEVYDVADGRLRAISALNTDLAASVRLAPTSYRQVAAPDGTVIDSWLVRADRDGAAPTRHSSPVLLYIQGGPTQFGWDFSFEFQYLAARGMTVLYCNPRGTTGYSEAWARTLCGPSAPHPGRGWGGYDLDDLVTVVTDTLAKDETLDPARVAAAGGSYGGILSALMATKWDGLAAAVAERGVYNFALMGGTSDIGSYAFDTLLGLDAVRDRKEFDRLSPLSFVDRLQIPLLLVHSTDDRRCPIPLAEEYFTAARRFGKDVTFVVFEGECHELSRSGRVGHRLQRLTMIGDWLTARLDGRLAGFEVAAEESGREQAAAAVSERGRP